MKEDIFERQDKEWMAFHEQRNKSRSQLDQDEKLVQKSFGVGEILPEEWQEKIERDRQAWQEEWAMDGRRASEIRERQQQERKPKEFATEPYSDEEMERLHHEDVTANKQNREEENIEIPDFMKAYYQGSDEEGRAILNQLAANYHKAQQDSKIATANQQAEHNKIFGGHASTIDPEIKLSFVQENYKKQAEEIAKEFGYSDLAKDFEERHGTESQLKDKAEELGEDAKANEFKENLQVIRDRNQQRRLIR